MQLGSQLSFYRRLLPLHNNPPTRRLAFPKEPVGLANLSKSGINCFEAHVIFEKGLTPLSSFRAITSQCNRWYTCLRSEEDFLRLATLEIFADEQLNERELTE
jgi:hypothetical protein